MSKLSFRARALDATKAMPIFRKNEVSDLPDYSVLNRAVPQMPTGMEKEEESEHHLQRAISAQQVYGDKKVMVIPVPEAEVGVDYYNNIYQKSFRVPKQYIHNQAQALNSIMEQEKPDYDMDSEDEKWVRDTNKRTGLEVADIQFEEMIDRLEKSCGNQAVTLQEAKLLLKEDDDLIKAVYDYWLQKRSKLSGALTFQVRQEKRDGSSSGDSYVAFRRRTEKMQTRKNRKNDEASYEKMLKLRRDLSRAVTILEMIKRREKGKRELLHLTLEVAEKRYQMKDWDGKSLKMARREALTATSGNMKTTVRTKHLSGGRTTAGIISSLLSKHKAAVNRRENGIALKKKRIAKKHRHEKLHIPSSASEIMTSISSSVHSSSTGLVNTASLKTPRTLSTKISPIRSNKKTPTSGNASVYPQSTLSSGTLPSSPVSATGLTYQQAYKAMYRYEFTSSEDERPKSPLSGSVAPEDERKKNPDGLFAFRRKPGCQYNAPLDDLSGDHWPWMTDDRHRYSLTTLTVPEKCMGFCRRRMGRGGRVLLDRAFSKWNKQLSEIDLNPEADHLPHKPNLQELLEEIKHGRWRRYRPYDPLTHRIHKLQNAKNKVNEELDVKSFGHSSAPLGVKQLSTKKEPKQPTDSSQVSSDSETVDIMTTDENFRGDLLHKRLLQGSPHARSSHIPPQRHRTTPQKHSLFAKGKSLVDKSSAMFAVSALASTPKLKSAHISTDCSPKSKSHLYVSRVQTPVKLNPTHGSSPTTSRSSMALVGSISGDSPSKYVSSAGEILLVTDSQATPTKTKSKPGKFSVDHAKFFGVKTQDVQTAAVMSVSGLQANSSTTNSVTFTLSGSTPKVSISSTHTSTNSSGVVSLTVAQPNVTASNYKNSLQTSSTVHDGMTNSTQGVRSMSMPVTVMATLRISNPVSSAMLQGSVVTNSNISSHSNISSSSYTVNNRAAPSCESSNSISTVFIAPSSCIQYTKASGNEHMQSGSNVPLTFTTVSSSTLTAAQIKQNQHGLMLSQQQLGPNLNLAITPASPQKLSSQLSIPHTSGHSQAVLIATPAGGGLTSNLPSHCASATELGTTSVVGNAAAMNLNHTKTVSINVARVQSSSSSVGQIFTLQQNPDAATLTVTGSQPPSSQHATSTWVTSGSGPNILKLGTAGVGAGIQIQPVIQQKESSFFKVGSNKSLTVISKRMRNVPPGSATRTISIANSKQQAPTINNNSKTSVSSHITLVPDGRNSKPLISIGHPPKNNTVVLATKDLQNVEQPCLSSSDNEQIPAQINIQTETAVSNSAPVHNNKTTKSNQPMEVT